jgi:predicted nucleotidyltransferase
MRWVPSWLGETYCRLRVNFSATPFSVAEAGNLLGRGRPSMRVALSELSNTGYLDRVHLGWYVARPPETVIHTLAGRVRDLDRIPEPHHRALVAQLIGGLLSRSQDTLHSVVLYGSAARGDSDPTSDVDLLVVEKNLPENFMERLRHVTRVIDLTNPLRLWLWKHRGLYPTVQVLPLTPQEAENPRPLYLDMVHDAVLLYDPHDFFRTVINDLAKRLERLGSKRIQPPDGKPYWILKETVTRGEIIEI